MQLCQSLRDRDDIVLQCGTSYINPQHLIVSRACTVDSIVADELLYLFEVHAVSEELYESAFSSNNVVCSVCVAPCQVPRLQYPLAFISKGQIFAFFGVSQEYVSASVEEFPNLIGPCNNIPGLVLDPKLSPRYSPCPCIH